MLGAEQLPVLVVTGMAFEAKIAAGAGVITLCGGRGDILAQDLKARIAQGCQGIVSFGIAGGLAPDLEPGTCIVARSVVTASGRVESHAGWSSRLLNAIPGAIHADIAGVEAPITTTADKRQMAETTGAAAVDMESFLSIGAAVAHNLPFAAVRVVADPSHRSLPPAALIPILVSGKPDISAVLRSIAGSPSQLTALIRLTLDARKARAALARSRALIGPGFGLLDAVNPRI
jgi:adenosylhomocysteine nucleosidase